MQKLEQAIKNRFLEEISTLQDNKNTIANKIGYPTESFVDITQGNSLPGLLILSSICRIYPRFDSAYVITGVRREEDSEALRSLQEDIVFKKDLIFRMAN